VSNFPFSHDTPCLCVWNNRGLQNPEVFLRLGLFNYRCQLNKLWKIVNDGLVRMWGDEVMISSNMSVVTLFLMKADVQF